LIPVLIHDAGLSRGAVRAQDTLMPYKSVGDLSDALHKHPPKAAQEFYRNVYNHAWDQYAERKDHEAVAHKVS
jgi:hypothetical protein